MFWSSQQHDDLKIWQQQPGTNSEMLRQFFLPRNRQHPSTPFGFSCKKPSNMTQPKNKKSSNITKQRFGRLHFHDDESLRKTSARRYGLLSFDFYPTKTWSSTFHSKNLPPKNIRRNILLWEMIMLVFFGTDFSSAFCFSQKRDGWKNGATFRRQIRVFFARHFEECFFWGRRRGGPFLGENVNLASQTWRPHFHTVLGRLVIGSFF